mgnify:CR=1 FL=1
MVLIIILVLASSMIYIKVCLEEDSGGVIGWDHNYEPGVTEVLYAAGVLYLSHEDFEEDTNKYKLNYNGAQLLKYGLKDF